MVQIRPWHIATVADDHNDDDNVLDKDPFGIWIESTRKICREHLVQK